MRTPNCGCIICGKQMYRRPYELSKVRYVVCLPHRAEAQRLYGTTPAQDAALEIGRSMSTGREVGYKHSEETRVKISQAHKRWCSENSDLLAERGLKTRGDLHCKWKGGSSKINTSIRQMTENRRWMDAIKERDSCCVRCKSTENLEAHHIVQLSTIIEDFSITCREDALIHSNILWDLNNGITLCMKCHYEEHGRNFNEDRE